MKDGMKICRKCGKQISIITWGAYRNVLVDPEAVDVVPDADGEEFVRFDGSKIRGREAGIGTIQTEPAYRMHRTTCAGKR